MLFIVNMPNYETLAHMIVKELINIRKDFKNELERLGDRLEKCLSLHNTRTDNEASKEDHRCVTLPLDQKAEVSNALFDIRPGIEDSILLGSRTVRVPEDLDCAKTFVEVEVIDSHGNESDLSENRTNEISSVPKSEVDLDSNNFFPSNFVSSKKQTVLEIPEVPFDENQLSLVKIPSYQFNPNLVSIYEGSDVRIMKPSTQNQKKLATTQQKSNRPNVKRFQCSICDKCFYTNNHLKNHIKIHLSVKSHSCTYCNMAFRRKIDLNRHVRIHTGEMPFSCPDCGKKFSLFCTV